tara:strand:- start:4415 stop:4789 length:375 start_codon:yes stop_codon:yes gene_type:complete
MTLEDFMRIPTRLDWNREIEFGWPGPDGSTASTDHMMGVKIGVTSKAFEHSTLPANLHDWRYRLGRENGLGGNYRRVADVAYRDDCIKYIRTQLDSRVATALGVSRAWVRYGVLRAFGWKAFKK